MPKIDVRAGSHTVAVVNFETEGISAAWGPDCPTLKIRYELRAFAFTDTQEDGNPLHPITVLHISGELFSRERRLISRFRDDVCFHETESFSQRYHQGFLEIPLDSLTVERVESSRVGDFMGVLKLRAVFALHAAVADGPIQECVIAESAEFGLTIPKSHWVEQILPNLGYGQVEILEVRIPPNRDFGLRDAVKEIREAQALLPLGDWDNVVSHCRNAIEAIPKSQNLQLPATATFRNRVETFMNDCFGSKLGDDEAKYLADSMKNLWSLCSRPNHPSSSTFKRADAEFILRNTMALTEYFGRLLP
jgi:hypothetical protein